MNTVITRGNGPTSQEREEARALIAAVNEDARLNWDDQAWRAQMLADMTETVFEGFQHENLLELFTTVETADEEERITVEEVRGLEVFWVSLGGQIDQSRLTERVWELKRDFVGFHVSELERKMRNGFAKPASQLQALGQSQMDAEINARLFRTFQAAIPDATSPYYVGSTGLSLPALNTALTEVQDQTLEDQVAIVGRATMVNQILDELQDNNNYAPETNDQIIQTGIMGRYRGAQIVKLKNFKDRNDRSFFPANELYVVGRDASKVGFWGGLYAQEWTEQGGFYWHYMARREAGFAVHHRERVRRIVDTSLAS